jgi:uncharacterized membrane protein YhaH (DUF805 family)
MLSRNLLFSYEGRVGRLTYLIVASVLAALHTVVSFAFMRLESTQPGALIVTAVVAALLYLIVAGWINYVLTVKRFHDFGRSGWYAALLFFGPVVPGVFLLSPTAANAPSLQVAVSLLAIVLVLYTLWLILLLLFKPGDIDGNAYGPPPDMGALYSPSVDRAPRQKSAPTAPASSAAARAPASSQPAGGFGGRGGGFGRR